MYHDEKASQKNDFLFVFFLREMDDRISGLVDQVAAKIGDRYTFNGKPEFFAVGSFNRCYKVDTEQSPTIFRFPIIGKSAFRYEKTNDECAVLAYISHHTSIPVPHVIKSDCFDLGPFIVMPFIEGMTLSKYLQAPSNPGETIVLNPSIDIAILSKGYRTMARIILELSQCRFPRIGGLRRDASKEWNIDKRALTVNMNQVVACGNFPPDQLPQSTFSTANEYFTSLAEAHIVHLRTQRNDAVDDEADCRKKYIARCLFRNIARKFSTVHDNGPFPLYCDDFRPSNVIVDPDFSVRSAIDWEFCYAAPAEMTYCSPWWLLLAHPDDWEDGDLKSFLESYIPRQELFLRVLKDVEDMMIRNNAISDSQRLSVHMAQSLSNGSFWFCLAASSSFAFDDIYWDFIDQNHYGRFTSIEDRLALLSREEQNELEPLVQLKMQQAEEGRLDEHRTYRDLLFA
ncbi:putative phosphotransferase enzyme family protein [Phaeomoniella chlamydospora]|uniref:Putative phosphotransferase enzyme family protein n=1 Tax=Phaeomoniella chlamydospora TaxID=158046 RepID=A0A0G2H8Q1_PHACM|nr:putative phosphotransferase enzyme family protein [Phaeomoniella chlamydospora]